MIFVNNQPCRKVLGAILWPNFVASFGHGKKQALEIFGLSFRNLGISEI